MCLENEISMDACIWYEYFIQGKGNLLIIYEFFDI